MSTVRILCGAGFAGRKPGTRGSKRAQSYLVNSFKNMGLKQLPGLGYKQHFPGGVNIVGMVPGVGDLANEFVVVGAHYDHLGMKGEVMYPGANDNASGVAAVLAVAELIAAEPPDGRTVIFVLFDTEEAGRIGSKYFVEHPPVPIRNVTTAAILDMVGARAHDTLGDRLAILGTEKSDVLSDLANAASAQTAGLQTMRLGIHVMEELPLGRQVWSDYGSFRDAEVPFAFLTAGMNPQYHQPADTPDTLSPALLAGTATWLEHFARAAATRAERPRFAHAGEDYARDLRHVSDLLDRAMDTKNPFSQMPIVRPKKLAAHRVELDALQKRLSRGEAITANQAHAIRRAALRVSCYAGGNESPFASLCNAF